MKRILIFSDTHGFTDDCINIINSSDRVSAVIHAGDCVRDAEDLEYVFPNIPIHYVKGNNDFYTSAPSELTVTVGGKRIFITHGHQYRVKYEHDFRTLSHRAAALNADLVVFGHTHTPHTSYVGSMTIINPGSISYSHTYAVAEIDGNNLKTEIIKL